MIYVCPLPSNVTIYEWISELLVNSIYASALMATCCCHYCYVIIIFMSVVDSSIIFAIMMHDC